MANIKVVLKMNKIEVNGKVPIYIRITKDRKAKFISTGVKIYPKDWDEENFKVKKSHPNSKLINNTIAFKVSEAENASLELEKISKTVSATEIKKKLKKNAVSQDFFSFANEIITNLEKIGNISAYRRTKSILDKLKKYHKSSTLPFEEVTVSFLNKYQVYLTSVKKNKTNTVHSNLKTIRMILNKAIDQEIIKAEINPFKRFKLKTEDPVKNYLTQDELDSLEALVLKAGLKKTIHRDMYVFAAYAGGIRVSDVLQLKWSNFDGERISLVTQKTNKVVTVLLPQKALKIVLKYAPKSLKDKEKIANNYIFPELKVKKENVTAVKFYTSIASSTAYINKNLKMLAEVAKINKHISFHSSRHTFATNALRKGMRMEYVSKIMGHSNLKETQGYAKIINEELEKAMEIFNN
jgi:integrase/recombinase XerD